ncbi:MAG: TrmB family transcriptional regulator [Candidatus Bathyarchaeia archaeon]
MTDQISDLVDFGLTLLQARVYIGLVQLGTCRASMIASRAGLVRPETYRVLHELSSLGLVQRNLDSPSTYTAVSPSAALKALVQQHKRKVSRLNQKMPDLAKLISTSRSPTTDSTEALSVVTGPENLNLKEIQMISKAKEDFAAIVSKFGLPQLSDYGIDKALISAKRRGITVRVIVEVGPSNVRFANRLARHIEVRRTHDLLFCMDVADKSEVLFGPAFPGTEEEVLSMDPKTLDYNVWTKNPRFVGAMYTIFERLWEASPKYTVNMTSRVQQTRNQINK